MPTDADLGIAPAPDQPVDAPALAAPQVAPAPGSEGRTVTVRPRAPPKPPPAPIVPHETAPVAVTSNAPVADAPGQKPPTDEDLGIVPKSGFGADIGKSIASGLSEGVTGIAGLPHDAPALADYGIDWAAAHLNQALGGEDAQEAIKRTHGSAIRGAFGDKVADALDTFSPTANLPSGAQLQGWAQKAVPMLGYQPQTGAGRYAHEIAAFLPGAAIPFGEAGWGARALQTVAPAIGSETLGNMAKGTAWEPWARGFGALVGGGAHIVGGATKDAISEYARPISEAGQQDLAAQQFRAQTSEPDAALQKLRDAQAQAPPGRATGENIQGSKPTTGQITGDLGQLGMERAVQTASPELHAGQMTAQRAAQSKALGAVQPTGAPETVSDLVTKRLRDIDAQHEADVTDARRMHEEIHGATHERMSQEAAGAEQQARTAAGKVARRGDPEALGERAREALAASMAKAKERETALWRADRSGQEDQRRGDKDRRARPQHREGHRLPEADGGRGEGDLRCRRRSAEMGKARGRHGPVLAPQDRDAPGALSPTATRRALKRMATLNTTMENVIANSASRASAAEWRRNGKACAG